VPDAASPLTVSIVERVNFVMFHFWNDRSAEWSGRERGNAVKTVIVGGGTRCLEILELTGAGHVRELDMEVVCVADPKVDGPGIVFAAEQGIQTLMDYREALSLPGVELILELTGDRQVLADLYGRIQQGVRVIDHVSARVFLDLIRLEHSLREELANRAVLEDRFHQFINSASELIAIKDKEGRYLMANPATASLFGMEPSQLIGRTPAELYDPGVSEIIRAHDQEVIDSRKHANYTECFVIDGEEYYLDVTRFPLLDHQGNVNGVCSIARETTHRFLHLIFDSIAHGIFTVDSEGTVTSFNAKGHTVKRPRSSPSPDSPCRSPSPRPRCARRGAGSWGVSRCSAISAW
jgi:PAS domain S-box-containing protein